MSGDSKKVVGFPKASSSRGARPPLEGRMDRQAHLSVSDSLYYIECIDVAEKHGVSRATMKEMVEATRKANEKKAREDKAEDRQRERQIENAQTKARREEEHKYREQKREQERIEGLRSSQSAPFVGVKTLMNEWTMYLSLNPVRMGARRGQLNAASYGPTGTH
jgi:uncharacterized protein YaiL (DUF2058 family)